METGTFRKVNALRLLRAECGSPQPPAKILQIIVECDLVGYVELSKEALVLVIAARCDTSPREPQVFERRELASLHGRPSLSRRSRPASQGDFAYIPLKRAQPRSIY